MIAATPAVVPAVVQRAIQQHSPRFAFVPTTLPAGYSYVTWHASKTGYDIFFAKWPALPDLEYHAFAATCASYGRPSSTFEVGGVAVNWSLKGNAQTAWRCVGGFVFSATRSGRRGARDLAGLVAYARRAR